MRRISAQAKPFTFEVVAAVSVAAVAASVLMGSVVTGAEQARTTHQGTAPTLSAGRHADWSSHNVDLSNSRFSTLDQIDRSNVARLAERWTFQVEPGQSVTQVTPLVVDGVMYLSAPATLYALDATSGASIWTLELESAHPSPVRGPTYADGKIYIYNGSTLVAADAKTGELVGTFGNDGVLPIVGAALQFKYPDDYPPSLDPYSIGYRITTAPAYHNNTLFVGAALSEGHIPGGLLIASDATTGAIKWVFNTIPQRPQDDGWEIARDTWGAGARAGGGIWTQPAIDLELGLVYINSGNPSPDYDGSARPGINLFTNSTLALDMETGALRWHYQTVHHDLWDWDNVTGPVLFDVTVNGETIKGVGAAGKNCLLYLWHRETGQPINPMVETLVPTASNVPGEQVWPTQPIPHTARGVPMTPFCATYVHLDDPEQAARSRQMYTPYSIDEHLIVAHGGSSFGAPAFSPRTGLLYISGKNGAISMIVNPVGDTLEPGPDSRGHTENFEELSRIPDYTPSFTVTPYHPGTGEEAWHQILPANSSIGASGNLATAGDLVFQGTDAGGFFAFDAETGDELFSVNTRRPIRASPLTYAVNDTQYVAIVASDTVMTYALP